MKILVIGAGPVGLTLAVDLARRGIPCRIVDKNEARTLLSKALGVHSGVLRCLDATLGPSFTKKMIQAGRKVQKANLHIEDRDPIVFHLESIPDPYPFVLMIEQSETERLLEEELARLRVNVKRHLEVTQIEDQGDQVRVGFSNGTSEAFDYVVGCDGAHSITREAMGVGFEGGEYQAGFSLADADVEWNFPMEIRAFIQPNGLLVAFPFKDQGRYRVIYMLKRQPDGNDIDLETFQKEMKEVTSLAPKLSNPRWITRFRIHHRMVSRFSKGRIFLAGDAAHIHSPVGGQGMNLGIQDALNLSNKFARLQRGEDRLNYYSPERMKVARKIVNGTDRLTSLGIRKDNTWIRMGRNYVFPWLASQGWIQRRAARALSQVDLAKVEIPKYF